MSANAARTVKRTGPPAPGNTVPEGTVVEVTLDEKISDPNDPRAVQVPEEGVGGGNPLDVHSQPSPNEVFGGAANFVNPHTGEVVAGPDADATEVSPTPSNVETAETVEDVQTAADLEPTVVSEEEAKEEAKTPEEVFAEPESTPPADEEPPQDPEPHRDGEPEPPAPGTLPGEEPPPPADESPSPV